MGFSNPITGGEDLIRSGIRSPNYVAGATGWRIAQDGSAEFNNVTVRGTLAAGTITGDLILAGGRFITGVAPPYVLINTTPSGGLGDYPTIEFWWGSGGGSGLCGKVQGRGGGTGLVLDANGGYVDVNNGPLIVSNGTISLNTSSGGGIATILGMRDNELRLRTPSDGVHYISFDAGIDGVAIRGNSQVSIRTAVNAQAFWFGNDGTIQTVAGWSIQKHNTGEHGVLYGKVGGSGGGLSTRNGGNQFSTNWDGTLRLYIDATNVKNFVIPHPSDPARYLVHACLEGPEAAVYYRGAGQLVDGVAEIKLPSYFEALCDDAGRSVLLTCIADNPNDEWCPVLHATYPQDGRFAVGLGSGVAVPDQRFWWQVTAVRRNAPVETEPLQTEVEVFGDGPYTYYRKVAPT